MELREARHQRQPDADSGRVPRRVRSLTERLEHRVAVLGRNAGALVLHGDDGTVLRRLDADPHACRRGRVSHRVREEVLDDPLELARVDRHDHRVGLEDHLSRR